MHFASAARDLTGAFGKNLLRGDKADAEGEVWGGDFGGDGYLFQRADDGDGVHVVEVADVGDAEEGSLHLALAVGDDGGEFGAQALDEDAGVDARRRDNGGGG